jgi:hypothetical protein
MNYRSMDNLVRQMAQESAREIKSAPWFPFKTGRLRDMATYVAPGEKLINASTYCIVFDSSVAPYVGFLEEGTKPHDIPGAFGYPRPFGIGGRFDGKFHPGSTKHEGFISNKSVNLALSASTGVIVRYLHAKFVKENQ